MNTKLTSALILSLAVVAVPANADEAKPAAAEGAAGKSMAFEAGLALGLNVSTTKLGVGPGVGVDLGARFRVGPGAFTVHLRTQYQRYGKEGTVDAACSGSPPSAPCMKDGTLDYKMNEQALDLALRLAYRIMAPSEAWSPYVGAGPKLFLLKARTTSLGLDNTETDMKFGFTAFGGALMNLGPGHGFAELEYQWAGLSHKMTGDAHLAGLGIIVGYRAAF